ncbi:GtrA family protein [Polynucleobacter sp.]|uniref:GtrA family protein n=1 Tax=Polynucleobacter sp. TaxID=2029855 RepID=UPI0027371067|nr:GtrA family protein [Polynucleobacter sp.]MDP3122715.1 GtrA family protein [Polynucleobacter sp.]
MKLTEKKRYLIAGIGNSVFGYSVGLMLYESFSLRFHIIMISVIANILAISFAFLTYKMFVFKTQGNWVSEYMKCYLVYGGTAVFGTLLIWLFVDFFKWPFWISQLIVIGITMVASYFIHRIFTFIKISKDHGK